VVGDVVASTALETDVSFACTARKLAEVSAATGSSDAGLYRC